MKPHWRLNCCHVPFPTCYKCLRTTGQTVMLLWQMGCAATPHGLSHIVQLLGIWAATGIPLVVVDPPFSLVSEAQQNTIPMYWVNFVLFSGYAQAQLFSRRGKKNQWKVQFWDGGRCHVKFRHLKLSKNLAGRSTVGIHSQCNSEEQQLMV